MVNEQPPEGKARGDLSHIPLTDLLIDLAAANADIIMFERVYPDTSVRVYRGQYSAQEVIDENRRVVNVITVELERRTAAL